MRSARELRNAGGNVRLASELESLLEEIHEKIATPTILRNAMLRLVSLLQEPSTTRLFADKGLDLRFLDLPISKFDAVNSSLRAMVVLQLLTHSQSPLLISRMNEQQVEIFLVELLSNPRDLREIAFSREANMSKRARQDFRSLCEVSLKSITGLPKRPSYLSNQFLGLQCLRLVAEWKRDNAASSLSLSDLHLRKLIFTSVPQMSNRGFANRDQCFSMGLAIFIIEAATMNAPELKHVVLGDEALDRITGILSLLPAEEQELRALTFELYINLTQAFPGTCVGFVKSEAFTSMLDQVIAYFGSLEADTGLDKQSGFNQAILSLMCLINITETSEIAREKLVTKSEETLDEPPVFNTLVQIFRANSLKVVEVSHALCYPCM